MRKVLGVLGLFLIACLSLAVSDSTYVTCTDRDDVPTLLAIPSDVTTPDDVRIPAGEYRVGGGTGLLYVGRPDASLGFWPKPPITLYPVARPPITASTDSVVYGYTLNVAVEVKVVYDVPKWQARRQQTDLHNAGWAPYIRNRQLLAVIHNGEFLYITKARALHAGRPHIIFRPLRPVPPAP